MIKRLGIHANVFGQSQYPDAGDLPISVEGQVTLPGSLRTYQIWYRDPMATCTGAGFNLSNAMEVVWLP